MTNPVNDGNHSPIKPLPHRRSQNKSRTKKMNHFLFLLGGVTFVFIFIVGTYYQVLPWNMYAHGTNTLDNLALKLGLQKHVYAVVIDAGSTGSRVLAFTFHKSLIDGNLKLDSELFVQVKPGLSSFADNPKEGGQQMLNLLERAKDVVPPEQRGSTPLAMKATAGLRLLPRDKADMLIEEAREVFRESPFHTTEHTVSIMDGTDEGLFSWFTVNFLQDRFGDGPEETVAALDLGGGSTQVTFALGEEGEAAIRAHDPESVHEIQAFHHKLSVYTHSYLGLGLMAGRQAILTAGQPENVTAVHSPCVNPIINTTWEYAGINYNVM
ncbi:hypothetical protein B566_EDAN015535 [Ephemera danica]|nr:hypothetical protein B566_EDAN015535 [Ephemera danica]